MDVLGRPEWEGAFSHRLVKGGSKWAFGFPKAVWSARAATDPVGDVHLCVFDLMVSATDSDLASCSGSVGLADGGVSNVCRPCLDETEYLCYFMHRLLDFRHPEIRSLAALLDSDNADFHSISFQSPCGGSYLSPFWYVRLPSETLARSIAQRSLLVKVSRSFIVHTHFTKHVIRDCPSGQGFLELWGEGTNWDELIASVKSFPQARRERWNAPDISFKFVVDGWGKAIKQQDQIAIMHKFQFLGLQVRPEPART